MIFNILLASLTASIIMLIIPLISVIIKWVTRTIIGFASIVTGASGANFIVNWLTAPGVVHHELAHASLAFITGAKIVSMDVFKKVNGTLGNVQVIFRGNILFKTLQKFLTAVAPVILGVITVVLLYTLVLPICLFVWQSVFVWYLIVSIVIHMTMSDADMDVLLSSVLVGIAVITVILLIADVNIISFIKMI